MQRVDVAGANISRSRRRSSVRQSLHEIVDVLGDHKATWLTLMVAYIAIVGALVVLIGDGPSVQPFSYHPF